MVGRDIRVQSLVLVVMAVTGEAVLSDIRYAVGSDLGPRKARWA